MKKPKISLVCPSYNHGKFISFFLDSVLGQTYENFELIIIDDKSSDNTIAEIEKYKDSRIKLFQNPFNSGINAGLNKAISEAIGEYVVFIASDDVLELNFLEVMVDKIEKIQMQEFFIKL
jgi:glycosyltransferase involved in cell wall biosynthesis